MDLHHNSIGLTRELEKKFREFVVRAELHLKFGKEEQNLVSDE